MRITLFSTVCGKKCGFSPCKLQRGDKLTVLWFARQIQVGPTVEHIIRRRGGSWATWQGPHQESVSANERPAAVSVLGCGGRRSSWPILLPDQLALPYFNDSSTYIIKLWLDTRLFELGPLNITYARWKNSQLFYSVLHFSQRRFDSVIWLVSHVMTFCV